MKIFLWIVVALGAVLALLLVPRVRVRLEYSAKQAFVRVKVLCFSIRIFPKKEGKHKQKDQSSAGKKAPVGETEPLVSAEILKIEGIVRELLDGAGRLLHAVQIDRLDLNAVVASPDVGTTAMLYGGACAAMGLLLPVIENNFRVKQRAIAINADFSRTEPAFSILIELSARPVVLIAIALCFAARVFQKILKQKKAVQHEQSSDRRTHVDNHAENP